MVSMPGFQSTRLVTEGALEPFFFLYTDDSIQGNTETCKQSSIMLNYEVKNIYTRIIPPLLRIEFFRWQMFGKKCAAGNSNFAVGHSNISFRFQACQEMFTKAC